MTGMQRELPFRIVSPTETPTAQSKRWNLVIEASAGTGKTTRIVREILEVLLDRPDLQPERIALVTFTEKAAAEIADRIRYALTDLHAGIGSGHPQWPSDSATPILRIPPDRIDAAQRACEMHLGRLERFRSQTIHAFCQSLLRLFPIEAGLNPGFRIIQGSELARLQERTWREWLQRETRADAAPDAIEEWRIALHHFGRLDSIRATIFSFLSKRDLLADASYTLGHISEAEPSILLALTNLRKIDDAQLAAASDPPAVEVVRYLRDQAPVPGGSLDEWIDYFTPIADALSFVNRSKAGSILGALLKPLTGGKSGDNRKTVHDRLAGHRAAVSIRNLTNRFSTFLDGEKLKGGVVDFDDLLLRTARLLENDLVLAELRARFDLIFVDEFQDTDRVQARIIDRLSRDNRNRLVEGRTVLVGDPKQSIYSFRRADPETYQQTVERFLSEGARREDLDRQYRSVPELVADINAMFGALFVQPGSEAVARPVYSPPLIAARADDGPDAPRITFLKPSPAEENGRPVQMTSHALQAGAISEWIGRRHRDNGEPWGRFAILFRKMTSLDDYLEVFDRTGIPYALPPARMFLETRVAVDLLAVLRAIASPRDRSALVSAARSPWFGLRDDEIARHYLLGPGEEGPFARFNDEIARWSDLASHLTVADLVDLLAERSEIESLYAILRGGDQMLLHLDRMRDAAIEFDTTVGGTLAEFVAEIDRRRGEADEADASWIDEHTDAVRVLTVHAAKGLEFESVLIPDLSARVATDNAKAIAIENPRSLLFTGRLAPIASIWRQTEEKALEEINAEREEAELQRLFYVAVTRARSDVTFVCDPGRQYKSGFWKSVASIFGFEGNDLDELFPEAGETRTQVLEANGSPVRTLFVRANRPIDSGAGPARFVHPTWDRLSALPLPAEEGISEVPAIAVIDRGEAIRTRKASRRRGFGIALHRLLELRPEDAGSFEPLVAAVAAEQGLEPADVERLRQAVSPLHGSPVLARIRQCREVGRELSIWYRDANGRAREGRIDLLLREDEHYLVVDYKSGRATPEQLPEQREQVQRYCGAIRSMTGVETRGLLWYPEEDSTVEL